MKLITTKSEEFIVTAYQAMRAADVHHLVVEKDRALVGVISDRDIFENGLLPGGRELSPTLRVGDVMHADLPVLQEDATLKDALTLMETHRVTGLPVLCDGKPYAVVTHTDLLRLMREHLQAEGDAPEADGFDRLKAEAQTVASHPYGVRLMELLNDIGL